MKYKKTLDVIKSFILTHRSKSFPSAIMWIKTSLSGDFLPNFLLNFNSPMFMLVAMLLFSVTLVGCSKGKGSRNSVRSLQKGPLPQQRSILSSVPSAQLTQAKFELSQQSTQQSLPQASSRQSLTISVLKVESSDPKQQKQQQSSQEIDVFECAVTQPDVLLQYEYLFKFLNDASQV
ncbi:unnamed protein product, partial [Mesorhabditis belari]|uniref:Uncharacterized protein n=1 Tax=Mesorhabditis belari TaxID=2138241 RepID=A0AAF3FE27_9BILA